MITKAFLLLAMVLGTSTLQARPRPRPISEAATEVRGEKATPGFAVQVREAQRISGYLTDMLVLSSAQGHAVEACTRSGAKPWRWPPRPPTRPWRGGNTCWHWAGRWLPASWRITSPFARSWSAPSCPSMPWTSPPDSLNR
ncbi:hypothetical protein [Hymenobacter sp. IS2118]|uniref:hypothetical protein n=1 Tax=Hymenobacter sp. IS2118 TaxID=1505605 RepID=UPI000556F7EB|nr:hypothetical protein [Hymenobacter sp. IS2118]